MKNWKPIAKVTVGTVTAFLLWLVQWVIPAWHNNVPMEIQVMIPWLAGMIAAYMTKLESRFTQNNVGQNSVTNL